MIKLILTIFIFFLSVNTSFALDYYDVENDRKYINGKKVRTMYLKDQKIEGESLDPTLNKEFQIVTNKERIIKSKPHYNKITNRFEFDEKLNGDERGIIAISTNERVKMVSFPKWKRLKEENDYREMEKIVNKFTDEIEKDNDREFKRRYGVNENTHIIISAGSGFSEDKSSLWGHGKGYGIYKSKFKEAMKNDKRPDSFGSRNILYKFIGLFYKSKLIKYFVNFNSTYTDTLRIRGQVKIGENNYVIIYEGQAESEKAVFPYLYEFKNEKLGKRIEPIYPVGEAPQR